jgi:hypothetical protein
LEEESGSGMFATADGEALELVLYRLNLAIAAVVKLCSDASDITVRF